MSVLRPIGHEDRLSIVDHLDELRTRLFVCAGALILAFGICFWQNHALIVALNRALPTEISAASHQGLAAQPKQAVSERHAFQTIETGARELGAVLSGVKGVPPAALGAAQTIAAGAQEAVKALPKSFSEKVRPTTLGVGESFTTTLMVVGYFSLLFALPVILFQLYAFTIPALSPTERRAAVPAMLAAPALFMAGVIFTYFQILPPAVHFLQGYNANEFNNLIQARPYYKFEIYVMLGIGLAFQLPLALLALQRAGVITSKTLTLNWRYAVVLIALAVAALPGVDPVTMTFETLPLVGLYLLSIVLLKFVDRRDAKRAAAELAADNSNESD